MKCPETKILCNKMDGMCDKGLCIKRNVRLYIEGKIGPVPKTPIREPEKPFVWWRVTLKAGDVKAERDIRARTEDARDIAAYVAREYPLAECTEIKRMTRAPRHAQTGELFTL